MTLDFNDAGEQRAFDVIPDREIVTLQMTVRTGGIGDGGWLKMASDGASEGLDCEFTVVDGKYAKKKLWTRFTLKGTSAGHAEAAEISRNMLRAILESARGFHPSDKSEAAQTARKTAGWQDFNGIRFVAQIGVRPPKDSYPAKNVITMVITPEKQLWKKPEAGPAPTPTPSLTTPPAGAIAKPEWAK